MENPFHPPQEVVSESAPAHASKKASTAYVWACVLWSAMAVLLTTFVPILDNALSEFELAIPRLTQILLHPMATVFFFVVAVAVITIGLVANSSAQRKKLGRIALVLGIVAATLCAAGLSTPILELLRAL